MYFIDGPYSSSKMRRMENALKSLGSSPYDYALTHRIKRTKKQTKGKNFKKEEENNANN